MDVLGAPLCCFLFQFYIKPQQNTHLRYRQSVVSYFNSTSNHNKLGYGCELGDVVSYFNSTSNHNLGYAIC